MSFTFSAASNEASLEGISEPSRSWGGRCSNPILPDSAKRSILDDGLVGSVLSNDHASFSDHFPFFKKVATPRRSFS